MATPDKDGKTAVGYRIVHVVPGIGHQASGTSQSVPALCRALAAQGHEVELQALAPSTQTCPDGVVLSTFPGWSFPRRLGISPAMRRSLGVRSRTVHILHNHGLWMMPNVYPGLVTEARGAKLVVSPRGTVSRWALERSKWSKRVLWWLGQRHTLVRAACFHATAESEAEDIRRLGFRQPIAVVPNGIDVPPAASAKPRRSGPRRLVFLSRIHPKKGVDLLIRAWATVAPEYPNWELVIAGPDEGSYPDAMKRLAVTLRAERVSFAGARYGGAKFELLADADLMVLPTHSENFGLVVLEALASGTPVITTKGTPWAALEREGCGWWIDVGEAPLVAALRQACALQRAELAAMGARGRNWVRGAFSWQQTATAIAATYGWLTGHGDRPSCVSLD